MNEEINWNVPYASFFNAGEWNATIEIDELNENAIKDIFDMNNNDAKSYTFKLVYPWCKQDEEKTTEPLGKVKLENANQAMLRFLQSNGFVIYKDIYDAFGMKYKKADPEVFRFYCGDYKAYQLYIRKLIAVGKERVIGAEANADGLHRDAERYLNLEQREREKAKRWNDDANRLQDFLDFTYEKEED